MVNYSLLSVALGRLMLMPSFVSELQILFLQIEESEVVFSLFEWSNSITQKLYIKKNI